MNVSEQQSEATSGETGSVGAGPAAPDMSAAKVPVTAAIESPMLAPDQQETSPKPDAPKVEAPRVEASKLEATKVEPAKVEAATSEAPKVETPRIPGKLLIMSPGERAWNGDEADVKPEAVAADGVSGKRRMSAMAAVVALATVAGALGGALATAGLGQMMAGNSAVANNNSALEASVARIDADILALKASVEHTSKTGVSQFNKTSDRLDKVEKAQAEPTAKLAKLSDAVEKLRAQAAAPAPVAAATPAAARDVTGTVSPPATAAAVPLPAPKPEIARLPTVDGWVLRDAANGSALIEGRQGIFEVYAGDPVPGLGRIDAIRKQDGKWVVVTSKGLIVAR
ncbi:hypothetical protein JQ597_06845 [Bradyrhizobium sp. AUGA SZCCT0177]|uniref:hypothetical protein n=1 Tax=Bradyrhizobium sp. AUGA SZCCT0177 TaxID=2807665 RepID=UPI001BA6EF77|nr:hypothetical protein [Bradyrhizobium sp. AUGA SZCCT0177]MBR1281750.1 hypothetical protein [Bradyrhizobium sp. AUGA SZCCT0177]